MYVYVVAALQKILIEAKQLDKQFCSWFASDCILTNLLTVISHVMVDEHRLQEPLTEVVLATRSGSESLSDYEHAIAVNDDDNDIDFPPPSGTVFSSANYLFHECCSRCRFQPYDCIIVRFVLMMCY